MLEEFHDPVIRDELLALAIRYVKMAERADGGRERSSQIDQQLLVRPAM